MNAREAGFSCRLNVFARKICEGDYIISDCVGGGAAR